MRGPVLFIHGWWAADWVWSRVDERFRSACFETCALTLPGPETNRCTFCDHLSYAREVARSLGNPILIGHSVGGLLAMKLLETVAAPACIAITPAAPAGIVPRPSLLLTRFLMAALPSMIFGRDFLPRTLLRQINLNRLTPEEQDDVLNKMRPVPASQVRRIVPSLIAVERRRIRSPLLIVGAAEDRLTPPAQVRAIASRYGADYREYPNASHFILREQTWAKMTSDLMHWIDDRAVIKTGR